MTEAPDNKSAMKKKIAIIVAALLVLYAGAYCSLRLTKYFVRQQFLCFACSADMAHIITDQYPDGPGPVRDGHTWYSYDSERNQIGCGRIQKDGRRFGEHLLLPLFWPLAELEMYVRGFGRSTMYIYRNVAEFERYDSEQRKVYYTRTSLIDQFQISRRDQD